MYRNILLAIFLNSPVIVAAQPLEFSMVNPSFGGNPINSSHLISLATKQYTPPVKERTQQSDLDYFASQIQRRTLSTIASEFTSNLRDLELGDGEQEFVIGDFIINYSLDANDNVSLILNQGTEVIEIIVPKF